MKATGVSSVPLSGRTGNSYPEEWRIAPYLTSQHDAEKRGLFVPMDTPFAPILSDAYALEETLETAPSNLSGSIYTPPWLARILVHKALAPRFERRSLQQLARLRILDPACGSGIILLAAVELLNARLTTLGKRGALAALAPQMLFGIDKNPAAAEATRTLLAQALGAHDKATKRLLAAQIRTGDTILDDPSKHFELQTAFDVILGNPPYGLARGAQLTPRENSALKQIFHRSRNGRINKYLAFMARGFELLRPGGTLAYIVPNAWLGIKEARNIRELFLKGGELHEVVILPSNTFPGRGVETVLFVVQRGLATSQIEIRRSTIGPAFPRRRLSYQRCQSEPEAPIPILWDDRTAAVWEHLTVLRTLSGGYFDATPRIALQAYATGRGTPPQSAAVVREHPFHSRAQSGSSSFKYLQGRDIKPYRITWSGWYLSHGPWLAEPQQLAFFSGPRVIVREILAPPPYSVSSAYIEETALYNRSVLHILSQDTAFLHALVGILNSRLATFIFMTRGRKGARHLFPKLLIADLKEFPLPDGDLRESALSRLVARLGDTPPDATTTAAIDRVVYELYRLPPGHIATIERTTAKIHPSLGFKNHEQYPTKNK